MLVGTCPYYLYHKGDVLFCECATMKYPDKLSKSLYLSTYCCNDEHGYKSCKIYPILNDYYNRLYDGEKIEPCPKDKGTDERAAKNPKGGRPSKFSGG